MPILVERNIEERMGQGTFGSLGRDKRVVQIRKGTGEIRILLVLSAWNIVYQSWLSPIQLSRLAGTGLANIEQVTIITKQK